MTLCNAPSCSVPRPIPSQMVRGRFVAGDPAVAAQVDEVQRLRGDGARAGADQYLFDPRAVVGRKEALHGFGGVAAQHRVRAEAGRQRIRGEPVGDDISVTLIDITQRKHNEHKMLADALRDPLTGVRNRRGFEKDAAQGIRESEIGAVLYLDLNQFKSINDRFGHQAGDALLKAFGHRLEYCLRPEDVLGRLGGDEFAIVLPNVTIDDAKRIAERLVATASEAYIIQGQEIECAASVGIALMPEHGPFLADYCPAKAET